MEDIFYMVNGYLDGDSKRQWANAKGSKRTIGRITFKEKMHLANLLDNRQVFRCFLCKHVISSYLFSDCDSFLNPEGRIACVQCYANFDKVAYRRLFIDRESLNLEKFSLPFYVPMVSREERKGYDDYIDSFRMTFREIEQIRSVMERELCANMLSKFVHKFN